jgi:hypothetical protein
VIRKFLQKGLTTLAIKAVQSDAVRDALAIALRGAVERGAPRIDLDCLRMPYDGLGTAAGVSGSAARGDTVFITARFRSGSTMLWNLFRHAPGCTSYYEPFNERRWFDPAVRGERVDSSHKRVEDYWSEYEGLGELARYYREDWSHRDFFMDANFWSPDMKRYLDLLIERAPGRPVLQFNRIDFRLPWLRRHFPLAKIVHLYRHPREQWCSALKAPRAFPKDAPTHEFASCDKFYLRRWVKDLKHHFPFLADARERHPYCWFYFIWRLSYLFGRQFGDYSVCFERLVEKPTDEITKLMGFLDICAADIDALRALVVPPEAERWREYADDGWFKEHESYCEGVLREFLGEYISLRAPATTAAYS